MQRRSRFMLLPLSGADPAFELKAGQELLIGRNHSKVLLPNRHISRQQASFKVLEEPGTARQLIIVTNVREPLPLPRAIYTHSRHAVRAAAPLPRPRAPAPLLTPRPTPPPPAQPPAAGQELHARDFHGAEEARAAGEELLLPLGAH